jgi:High potential iron-sulfur protein
MKKNLTRREALASLGLVAGTLIVACGADAGAAKPPAGAKPPAAPPAPAASALPHVLATDPLAVALSYHESAKGVDAKKFPMYKPEQKCSNCLQLKGTEGEAWRPCNLFPGKLVNSEGWCKVYIKKV